MDTRSPAGLLLSKKTRQELILAMRTSEANQLASLLGLSGNSYDAISSFAFRRGTPRYETFLDFFSVADDMPAPVTSEALLRVAASYELFDHQLQASRRVIIKLSEEPHRVLLHMPTGSGKTRTAMSIICELMSTKPKFVAIWLAHSEELCEQAAHEFETAWSARGNRTVTIQKWWGGFELDSSAISDGLIVAGLGKAYGSLGRGTDQIGTLAGKAGLVVIDEAHQAVAPTYSLVLDTLTRSGTGSALLGLTATPGRSWDDVDADEKLSDFFNRTKVTLEVEGYQSPVEYLIDNGYLAAVTSQTVSYLNEQNLSDSDLAAVSNSLEIPPSVLETLGEDVQRNLAILAAAEDLSRRHKRLIVFAPSKSNAVLIAAVLQARGFLADVVTGETDSAERSQVIARYKSESDDTRIIVNFGVLTTGFDAPRTSAAIIARPTKSLVLYSQMVGRATRGPLAGGNPTAEIVTVVDTTLPGFSDLVSAFTNWEDVWANG